MCLLRLKGRRLKCGLCVGIHRKASGREREREVEGDGLTLKTRVDKDERAKAAAKGMTSWSGCRCSGGSLACIPPPDW